MHTLDKGGTAILNLRKRQGIDGIVLGTHHLERFWKPLFLVGYQPVIVRSWHSDIEVVVPRYESLMAHSTNHGACPDVITQLMLPAGSVYSLENGEYSQL